MQFYSFETGAEMNKKNIAIVILCAFFCINTAFSADDSSQSNEMPYFSSQIGTVVALGSTAALVGAVVSLMKNKKASADVQKDVVFVLDETSKQPENFRAHMILYNNHDYTLQDWVLGFNFDRQIDTRTLYGAAVIKHIGDYYLLKGTSNIPPHGKVIIGGMEGMRSVGHFTDAPLGYFLINHFSRGGSRFY